MRIGIFGHYGNENLGDEGITEACIESSRRILGAHEIVLFSIVPQDSAARHNLDAYPIRRGIAAAKAGTPFTAGTRSSKSAMPREPSQPAMERPGLRTFLKRSKLLKSSVNLARALLSAPRRLFAEVRFLLQSYAAIRQLHLMIVAGSNQYLDNFGGAWGFPYTLLKWSVLCRLRGTRIVFLSIGAGPLDNPLSRIMVRLAIRLGLYHSYRDDASRVLVEGSAARLGGVVYPDLASNLDFPLVPIDYAALPTVVAINPMPVYGDYWFVQDRSKYIAYITKLAEFIAWLDRQNCSVVLFPTQARDRDAINDTVETLSQIEPRAVKRLAIEEAQTTQDVMRIIQSAHVVVPTRFHGVVFGVLAKRLVIGICYQAKAAAVLEAAGQRDFALSLDSVDATQLADAFERLVRSRETALAAISRRSDEVRQAIDDQYRSVLRLLSEP